MRGRILAGVTAGMLVVLLAMTAIAATHTVADDFSSWGYSGSTGSMAWDGRWEEIGDSGDDPSSGAVQVDDIGCVVDPCLTLSKASLALGNVGAERRVDLTDTTSSSLSYHIDFSGGLLSQILVRARVGNGSWQTLSTHNPGDNGTFTANLPVGGLVTIRFVTSVSTLVGASAAIDNVEIQVISPDPPTTSTSSSTTSTSSTSTSTSTSVPSSRTDDTTRPGPGDGDTDSGATGQTPSDGSVEPNSGSGVSPPSRNHGVVTDLTPRLGRVGGLQLEAQADLLVDFSTDVEEISLDLLASAALGFLLAVLWSRRLGDPDAAIG